MATKSVARVDRSASASKIVERGDIIPLASEEGLYIVVDQAGSGLGHVTSLTECDCGDWTWRGSKTGTCCKHIQALRKHLNVESCPMCAQLIEGCVYPANDGQECVYFDVCSGDGNHTCQKVGGI